MKRQQRKLTLRTETVRKLDLFKVQGGATPIDTWTNPVPNPPAPTDYHTCTVDWP